MLSHQCPDCRVESLTPTGAFWSCPSCRIAITTQALKFQHHQSPLHISSPYNGPSSIFDEPMRVSTTLTT